jgi:hypothetical protein
MSRWIGAVLIVLVIVLGGVAPLSSPVTYAQGGGTLGYGSKVFGRVLADTPVVTYSFTGSAGDLVQANVRNWVGTLDPHVDLVAPDGQTLVSSANNPLAEDVLEAQLASILPQSGIYLLMVSGQNGTSGEFLLKLYGRGPVAATPLTFGQGVDVNVPMNPQPQYFSFEAQDCPTVLTVTDLSDGQPFTFPFVVKVRNAQGQEIAYLRGGDALEDRVIVAPHSGRYEVEVISDDPQAQGTVNLLATCSDQAPGCIPGSMGAGAGGAGEGRCPSCFGDEFGGEMCDAFGVMASRLGDGTYAFTWTPVEGADYYIFTIVDGFGTLVPDSAVMLEGGDTTSHIYSFAGPAELARGPFRVIVDAGAADTGYLCTAEATFGPEGAEAGECEGFSVAVHVVSDADRMVVVEWGAVPGADHYLIHIYAYGDDGGLVAIQVLTVPGEATTYHVGGVFHADYERFQISVGAYGPGDHFLCSGSADVEFSPMGPVRWGPAA